ncbi:hypothetical protein BDV25DRAFT_141854 [Aspergillus avenaceus]|uniref:RING-type E3 ubiquitin transferase n=1 Tax=Aspergillus avenaceus TaxID=36643 RepID=A0A5N6TPV8_ASPAV|nr:hypothetical protein BDV25DRAFT_141854 [Aspergillus avenaceus]
MADVGDRMFCHACGGVWLRSDEHELKCPHCQSEFTEIIEIPPDTEAPDPPTSVPEARSFSDNPLRDHNPWEHDDSDDGEWDPGNGFRHRTYRSPDGRFTFSSTTYTSGGPRSAPRQPSADPLMPMVRGLDTIFHGLADTYRQTEYRQHDQRDFDQERGMGAGPNLGRGPRMFSTSFDFDLDGRRGEGMRSRSNPREGLHPRDADSPQPMATPLGTLGDILELFRADFGTNMQRDRENPVMTGPNPLSILSTLLSIDRRGDAVYSQEELDRVISQLVDMNGNRSAAPPAARSAIQSLPKKAVDREMLGSEGKAECSICMDSVELGTEVTVLPCKHWFHYNCIEMWLTQHNTCPHCRRSIDVSARPEGSSDNPVVISDSPPTSRRSSGHSPEHRHVPEQGGQSPWAGGRSQEPEQAQGNSHGGFANWVRSHFGGGN